MNKKHFSLAAKIISIFYIVLITMFSFDTEIFSIGFLINLIPTIIFTACLITSFYRPKLGGILFIIAGAGTIIFFNTYKELISFIAISIVPITTGILFYFSKKQ